MDRGQHAGGEAAPEASAVPRRVERKVCQDEPVCHYPLEAFLATGPPPHPALWSTGHEDEGAHPEEFGGP